MGMMDDMIEKAMRDLKVQVDPKFDELMKEVKKVRDDQQEILQLLRKQD